jgi:hypothetical protein
MIPHGWRRLGLAVLCCGHIVAARPQDPSAEASEAVAPALFAARLTPAEERWGLIPWRESLTDTLAEAEREQRPVFLLGADGDLWSDNC